MYGGEDSQPGWEKNTIAMHGDDGQMYYESVAGVKIKKPITTAYQNGDVIGVGVDYQLQQVFFTRNGAFLATHSVPVRSWPALHPSVGFHSVGESVQFQCEQSQFMYKGLPKSSLCPPQFNIGRINPKLKHQDSIITCVVQSMQVVQGATPLATILPPAVLCGKGGHAMTYYTATPQQYTGKYRTYNCDLCKTKLLEFSNGIYHCNTCGNYDHCPACVKPDLSYLDAARQGKLYNSS